MRMGMEVFGALLPDGVSVPAFTLVVIMSYAAAALTASFGLGGGLALLAVMTAVFPPAAVIPVHGVAQLGANFSRLALQWRAVVWPIIGWFAAGGAIGAAIGARVFIELPVEALKFCVGAFVLYSVWGPKLKTFNPGAVTFFSTGLIGGFLTMFFGATGPIAATMLGATRLDRLSIVASHAACMVAQHGLKSLAFGALGFAFWPWAPAIAAILMAGFLGSLTGVGLLRKMPETAFRAGFRGMLTMIALYLIADALFSILKTD